MIRSSCLLVLLVAAALVPAPARAEDQKVAAERYFRAGEKAYNAGQYLIAAQAFEEAYELLPVSAIAFSTAQAYRLQYFIDKEPPRLKRAVELYRIYVQQQKSGGRVADAVQSLAEIEPILARLEAEGKMGASGPVARSTRLMVVSQVDGARGTVDGQGGALPLVKEVAAGAHTITAEADGYFPVTIKATAVDGELIPVEIELVPRPAVLDVVAEGGARVAIDGRSAGTTPLRGVEVPAGRHYLTVTRRGRHPFAQEIMLARGKTLALQPSLRSTRQRKAVPWVLAGAGALLVGSGVSALFALSADSKAADLDRRRRTQGIGVEDLTRYEGLQDERRDSLVSMWILGGAAAATATAGVLLYFLDQSEAEAPPMRLDRDPDTPSRLPFAVRPIATPGGAGVVVGGDF